jgi:hypothetical protein
LDIIDRAMASFSATGINPDRYDAHLTFALLLLQD